MVLPGVAKPARYTGGELNSVQKVAGKVSVRFALAFPDIYEVGMSNLGLRILYHILNSEPEVAAERVFAPATDMEGQMRDLGIPLFSLESSLPVRSFDVVGFSLAYEISYTTVLNMLELAGIPVYSKDRTSQDPIIIAGGHCAVNPEPMADFIDAFAIGDGEEVVLDIARVCKNHKGDRSKILEALSEIEGVYVPALHTGKGKKISARIVRDLEHASFPDKLVVPFIETVHDRVTLEIMRGCSRGCRFCQAGMITRPVRERSLGTLCRQADTLLKATGYEEIALTSLSSADHSCINDLVTTLINQHEANKVGISLPSLRADSACVELAEQIQRVRKSGMTFAPEAGTQRLRDVINKNVTEEDLLGAVEAAVAAGWKRVKLYFMIGLPTETDEDLEGIGKLVTHVIDIGRKHRVPLTLNVTISPFVPKPHTPFQWRGMVDPEELERKISVIRPLLRGKNIQLSWHEPSCSRVEAALARGDRRISKVIHESWRLGGKLEQDKFDADRWQKAFEAAGLDIADYANADIPMDTPLAWDFVDMGVTKKFLARENVKADAAESTPDCRFGICSGCGISNKLKDLAGEAVPCPPLKPVSDEAPTIEKTNEVSDQQVITKVVFTFRKAEGVRWLGHLDIMRVFEHAIRMSDINIAYSQGFNPKPKMSIASALPLGATADEELFTIQMHPPVDLKDVMSRLNRSLPEGLRLTSAKILPESVKGVIVSAAELIVEVLLPETATDSDIEAAISEIMSLEEIPVERESGRKVKKIDIRPGISTLELINPAIDHRAHIRMVLPHREFTVKPSEVIDQLENLIHGLKLILIHRNRLITNLDSLQHNADSL